MRMLKAWVWTISYERCSPRLRKIRPAITQRPTRVAQSAAVPWFFLDRSLLFRRLARPTRALTGPLRLRANGQAAVPESAECFKESRSSDAAIGPLTLTHLQAA